MNISPRDGQQPEHPLRTVGGTACARGCREPDRSQRNESGVRLFLTPLLSGADRRTAYERDLRHVEVELAELHELRAQLQGSQVPETFGPQIELGIRINTVIRDWLTQQVDHADD